MTGLWLVLLSHIAYSQSTSPYEPDSNPSAYEGYELVWQDEFNQGDSPDTSTWIHQIGFIRNKELQWYQPDNASIRDGLLVIEGRRERVLNDEYDASSSDWRKNRKYAKYTSSSMHTWGNYSFKYGMLEVRARIDTALGMWPAIWTLGDTREHHWPACGEIDVMEYYRVDGIPSVLANAAWADEERNAVWDNVKIPFNFFLEKDPEWPEKFHVWTMDWTKDYIKLYLDGVLLNKIDLTTTLNPDGFNPFHQPHYILLNLAIGALGGDPSETAFPRYYEVDYVRVYQKE